MIIRKPYAFLIKNFKRIHIVLLLLSLFVAYKVFDVSSFVNEFMKFGTYDYFKDPITNKGIILVEKEMLKGKYNIRSPMYVPFNSLNNHGLLKCFKPKYIIIENKIYTDYLIGVSDRKFNIDGISCILNYKLMEELKC